MDVWKQPLSLVSTSQSSSELTYFINCSVFQYESSQEAAKIVFLIESSKMLGALSDQSLILSCLALTIWGASYRLDSCITVVWVSLRNGRYPHCIAGTFLTYKQANNQHM